MNDVGSNQITESPYASLNASLILDREEFGAWLESLPLDTNFIATNACNCPIAKYLSNLCAKNGHPISCSVTQDYFHICGEDRRPMPDWAYDFVRYFDRGGDGSLKAAKEVFANLDAKFLR